MWQFKKILSFVGLVLLLVCFSGCGDSPVGPEETCEAKIDEATELHGEPTHIEYLPETYDIRGHRFAGGIEYYYSDGAVVTFYEIGDRCKVVVDEGD